MTPDNSQLPWQKPPLNQWVIVGMNHYRLKGKRHLFVAMSKDNRLIQAEGQNESALFKKLANLAAKF